MLPGITSTMFGKAVALSDPKTVLLLHMDGTAQAFIDSSQYHKTIVAAGNYTQGTPAKFGAGAGVWTSTVSDYLYVSAASADPDFAFGTADFTIDFWMRSANVTTQSYLIDWRPATTNGAYLCLYYVNGKLNLIISGTNVIIGAIVVAINTYYHIALVRASGVTKLYVNGVAEAATYTDANNYVSVANRPFFGLASYSASGVHQGQLDEIRISKGIARWTANFTPPTAPYV